LDYFKRSIEVRVDEEEGGLLRLHGKLRDRRLDEDLHGFDVMMLVNVWDGEILEIEGAMPARPLEECVEGLKTLQGLKGAKILPGFSDFVKQTVGSNRGCVHLASLIMNMGNTSVQGRGAYVRKNFEDLDVRANTMKSYSEQLGMIDSCICWREDGPLVRMWKQQNDGGQT
jgi:hypothetical protein